MSSPYKRNIVAAQKVLIDKIGGFSLEKAKHTCWACYRGMDDPNFNPEKAHIISERNGGSSEPSNFFLLCTSCHKEQPDGNPREIQIDWLLNHPTQLTTYIKYVKGIMDLIEKEIGIENRKELIINLYGQYLNTDIVNGIREKATSKNSGSTNLKSNVKFWMLNHFRTWFKLMQIEGKFMD